MWVRMASMLMAAACLPLAAPAPAAPLQPTANWDLDYGETQCAAARSYGAPDNGLVLAIVPSLSSGSYQLLVSLQRQGPVYAQGSTGTVDFGTGSIASPVLYYGGKGVRLSNYQFRVPAAAIESARSASSIRFSVRNGEQFDFAVTDMPALVDALRGCTADLQQYWNLNRQNVRTVAKSLGDLHYDFSSDDFPSEAMWKGQSGTGQYQLQVDESGAIAACDVASPSGVPLLDVRACQVIRERARFIPAKDALGRAIRSVVVTPPVSWRMSDDTFTSSCTWNLGREGILLNMCNRGRDLQRPFMRPPPAPPPPPPPPPSGTGASASMRSLRR
jgi:TonB family protein